MPTKPNKRGGDSLPEKKKEEEIGASKDDPKP